MKKISILTLTILLFSLSVHAIVVPSLLETNLKNLYPKASGVIWSQDAGYYYANFIMNGLSKNVWFNARGEWQMTQTDLVSLDELSPAVYNSFVSSQYADGVVENVTLVNFPKWQSIIVIKVGKDAIDLEYQLFYTPNGTFLKARNVTYMNNILGPSTFL